MFKISIEPGTAGFESLRLKTYPILKKLASNGYAN